MSTYTYYIDGYMYTYTAQPPSRVLVPIIILSTVKLPANEGISDSQTVRKKRIWQSCKDHFIRCMDREDCLVIS